MTIFIGGAWPYVNGRLHVGHIASLLPGDVLARYFRIKGEEVLYVSGSDCHGTPISVLAARENVGPSEIADKYHQEITDCFEWLGFSYDLYTRTDSEHHRQIVQDVFLDLYRNGFLYEKSVHQAYCTQCGRFLPDRFIEGICPKCGQTARGDQCDSCSTLLDPLELLNGRCKICGTQHEIRETKHLFISLSKFQAILENYVDNVKSNWRENAVKLTNRYLVEGLRDRAVTRDLSWGIDVPIAGYEGKKIYVWIEAVLGYLSASIKWAENNQKEWQKFWGDHVTAYYVHGKDNIPFHSLILPALLLGSKQLHLPDKIVSSEYLTIEGKKISTSSNWAIWASELKKRYHPDSVRYYLITNSPESRDTDFSWREFVYQHNSELLGDFGNFVNRTLVFAKKYFDAKVPLAHISQDLHDNIKQIYKTTGKKIAKAEIKSALEEVFTLVRYANKYFDQTRPWKLITEDPQQCKTVIFTCIQIIVNLSNLLTPFLPNSCDKIRHILGIEKAVWDYSEIAGNHSINEPKILFERIDKSRIEEEVKKMHE